MHCKNRVSTMVPRGYHYKEVMLPCGSTGPDGYVVLCEDCLAEAEKQFPQGWNYRPGDTCKHGVYQNPEHDCCCSLCEIGE